MGKTAAETPENVSPKSDFARHKTSSCHKPMASVAWNDFNKMEQKIVAPKTLNAPDWLDENELLSLLHSHAATKYEHFAGRARPFAVQYGCD